jgi:hypothetical protein
MRSLNDFKANLEKFGTVKQNRFDVFFFPRSSESSLLPIDLTFRCDSLNIPGIQILTTDFHLYGGEPIVKIPNGRTNDEVQMTFLAMADMRDKYWFEEWLHKISDFENNNIAYYDDVASDIDIDVYNERFITKTAVNSTIAANNPEETGEIENRFGNSTIKKFNDVSVDVTEIYTARLVKAIPTRVEMIQVSWADTDQLMKYTVNFSYESLKIVSSSNRSGDTFSHLDKVQK